MKGNHSARSIDHVAHCLAGGPRISMEVSEQYFMNKITMTNITRTEQWMNATSLGLLLALCSFSVSAQVALPKPAIAPPGAALAPANPDRPVPTPSPIPVGVSPTGAILDANQLPLRVMGAGVFQLANVTMDKRNRSVSFPAVLNMDQGPMEYFLVATY